MLFLWLLARKAPLPWLAITSVVTLGITLTNFVQQALTDLMTRHNLRRTLALTAIVILSAAIANILAHAYHPTRGRTIPLFRRLTYALVLFVAINLSRLQPQNGLSGALLALTMTIFLNQMWFVYLLAGVVRPFLAGN